MRSLSHRLIVWTGMAAYAAFASGFVGALHASAHVSHHSSDSPEHQNCTARHNQESGEHTHDDSHNPKCATCYQIVAAGSSTIGYYVYVVPAGDVSRQITGTAARHTPAATDCSSIIPRAPPIT